MHVRHDGAFGIFQDQMFEEQVFQRRDDLYGIKKKMVASEPRYFEMLWKVLHMEIPNQALET